MKKKPQTAPHDGERMMFDWSPQKKKLPDKKPPASGTENKRREAPLADSDDGGGNGRSDHISGKNRNKHKVSRIFSKKKETLKQGSSVVPIKAPPVPDSGGLKLIAAKTTDGSNLQEPRKDGGKSGFSENWDYPSIISMLNSMDSRDIFKNRIPGLSITPPPEDNAAATVKEEYLENETTEDKLDDELLSKLIKSRFPPMHSGKEHFNKELQSSASPYANAFREIQAKPAILVDDFGDRALWEMQLNNSNLPGMELEECHLIAQDPQYLRELRKNFKRARRDFLKYISYHNQQDLYAAGLNDVDISQLRKGRTCENFNVHTKIPYEYGGTNDFSNMCLIQTHPYHDNLHKFLDMQIFIHPLGSKVKRLFIPVTNSMVYVPYLDITGSGGKSKHDRSVYAGFHKETFDLIAQKTSIGKAAEL